MVSNSLDDRMKANIDNYGKKIETLKDFVTAVRTLPGMYITAIGNRGYLNMQREVYQNAIDQIKSPNSPCDRIIFYYNEKTLECTVEDNGVGLPFDKMVNILTAHHTSSNYTKQKGEYSSGRHGSGLKAVNGLSSQCYIESYHYSGVAKRLETVEGYPTRDIYDIPNKEKKQGCKVSFIPCLDVLGEITLPWERSYKMVKQIISLTPIGSTVTFIADDIKGVRHQEIIVNKDGINTELIERVKSPVIKPITFGMDTGEMKVEVAFCYDSGADDGPDPLEHVSSFCNMTPTRDGGAHVDGVMDGITRWFTLYMNNIYLANQKASKNKIKVTSADIKSGLNVVISAAVLYPTFGGQAKDSVTNEELEPFCKDVVMKGLDEWSRSNPTDLAKIARYFRDLAEIRQKSESSKAKIATKYQSNSLTGLPSKYTKPLGKKGLELLIVEGDSAGGTAKTARNKQRQGVFPIRGKIINPFQNSRQKVMENAEVQGIFRIVLGKDYTRNFDPHKDVVWDKIIFMADADVDGAHIAALLLRLFLMYMPQLIEAGKVYKAVPPLYSVRQGKKTHYFVEQLDITRYIQKFFLEKYALSHLNKKTLTSKETTLLFLKNTDLVYYLELVAGTYAVPPELLEAVLLNRLEGGSVAALKKTIKSMYRFMDVSTVRGITCISGTSDKSNVLYCTPKLFEECEPIFRIMKENPERYYLLNGAPSTLYTVMKLFENCTPKNIQRYKGLGEMDDDELAESTMDPDGDRTLIRYTIEDAKDEIEIIRDYESDLSKLLDLVGTVNRADLLD